MFVLNLTFSEWQTGRPKSLRGLIACASDGEAPDYWVSLGGSGQPFRRAMLKAYPRWAEPVRAFVARAIEAVELADGNDDVGFNVPLECVVEDWRTKGLVDVISVGADAPRARLFSDNRPRFVDPWSMVRRHCAFQAFGGQRIPMAPEGVRLRLYQDAGGAYCRLSDLPHEARAVAERAIGAPSRMFVPAIPDAVQPWAVAAFLQSNLPDHREASAWTWP